MRIPTLLVPPGRNPVAPLWPRAFLSTDDTSLSSNFILMAVVETPGSMEATLKLALPAGKLCLWPALVSTHCAELLKTAEMQSCCCSSPEAPSWLREWALEISSSERKQCYFVSHISMGPLLSQSRFCCCREPQSQILFLVCLSSLGQSAVKPCLICQGDVNCGFSI